MRKARQKGFSFVDVYLLTKNKKNVPSTHSSSKYSPAQSSQSGLFPRKIAATVFSLKIEFNYKKVQLQWSPDI